MEKKTVLGTDIATNGKVLFLFEGESKPVWGAPLNGRELPKSGSTVYVVKRPKEGKPKEFWTNIYW
jgi:hypothetical protein